MAEFVSRLILVSLFVRNLARHALVLSAGVTSERTRFVSREEVAYFLRRAEDEIALAQAAEHRSVVQAHYELASAYLDRIHGEMPKAASPIFAG
jgi:hypothetical protein